MNWDGFRNWLEEQNSRQNQNYVWKSRYKSMIKIAEGAEWLGVDADWEHISIANWHTIIGPAQIAIKRQDRQALALLFHKAATMRYRQLHIEINGHRRSVVKTDETFVRGRRMITLLLPEEEFRLVNNRTDISIEYVAQEREEERTRTLPYQVV